MMRLRALPPAAALALCCSLAAVPAAGGVPKGPTPPASADAAGEAAAPPDDGVQAACIQAYEQVQTLREQGQLLAARQQAIACARDACPKVLAAECAEWLGQISQSLPTVVLGAESADGRDLVRVRVLSDGKPFATEIGARALPIDPGAHRFRFESPEHGTVELQVVVREGEKNRRVLATFEPKRRPAAPREADAGSGAAPAVGWVLGAVGLAGIGFGIVFEAIGLGKAGDLESCKPSCPAEDTEAMSRSFLVGDVALVAGSVALAAGIVVLIAAYASEPATEVGRGGAELRVVPVERGALGALTVRF